MGSLAPRTRAAVAHRRVVRSICALALVLLLASVCTPPGSVRPAIKVGLVASFEGAHRAEGYEALYGARLAVQEQNRKGGIAGRMIELVALDDSALEDRARRQPSALAADPDVLGAIGHAQSGSTEAALPEYARLGLPLVAISGCAEVVRQVGTVYVQASVPAQVSAALAAARELRPGAAVLIGRSDGLRDAAPGLARIDPAASDWLAALQRVHPSVAALDAGAEDASDWSRSMGESGSMPLLVGGLDLASAVFTEWAAPEAEVLVAGVAPPGDLTAEWMAAYRELAGAEPGLIAPIAYDGMRVLLAAADKAAAGGKLTRAGVASALGAVTLDGLTGPVAFDADGRRTGANQGVWLVARGQSLRIR